MIRKHFRCHELLGLNCRAPSHRLHGRQPSTNIQSQPTKPGSPRAAGSRKDSRPSKWTTTWRPAQRSTLAHIILPARLARNRSSNLPAALAHLKSDVARSIGSREEEGSDKRHHDSKLLALVSSSATASISPLPGTSYQCSAVACPIDALSRAAKRAKLNIGSG